MATDNTTLPNGGDTLRTIAKAANTPVKTQMFLLDLGGGTDGSPEFAFTGGPPVGAGSLATNQVALAANTVMLLCAARTGFPGTGRVDVTIVNTGNVTVFVGPLGVTVGTGASIAPGGSRVIATTGAVYGVATAAASVDILETY